MSRLVQLTPSFIEEVAESKEALANRVCLDDREIILRETHDESPDKGQEQTNGTKGTVECCGVDKNPN
jgi:hypothetical protein